MQRLASRCWPNGLHPGGLGWSHATDQLADHIVVIDDGDRNGELAGWAGITQPNHIVTQVAASRPEVIETLVDWFLATGRA